MGPVVALPEQLQHISRSKEFVWPPRPKKFPGCCCQLQHAWHRQFTCKTNGKMPHLPGSLATVGSASTCPLVCQWSAALWWFSQWCYGVSRLPIQMLDWMRPAMAVRESPWKVSLICSEQPITTPRSQAKACLNVDSTRLCEGARSADKRATRFSKEIMCCEGGGGQTYKARACCAASICVGHHR
jgi:hypothetical protein